MIADTLRRLFEADIDADDYEETAPAYELHGDLGWPPWWPPLYAVWAQPEPPADDTGMARDWPKARAALEELHQQYLAARGQ